MTESDEERLARAQARMLEVGLRLLKEGEPEPLGGIMPRLLREHEERTYKKRIKFRDMEPK